ncbi:MAG: TolC family protein [Bacteroidales bacterium]|nr:TolC family protein [Bacteroidota bacterium]MBL6949588.1 TolC family protein [Bacteroidales bacterium]
MKAQHYIKIVLFTLLFVPGIFLRAQDMLNSYLQDAANHNPELKSRFSEYMASLEKIPQVGTLPDPTVAFGYFIMPVETRVGPQRARISASQMFPWFGTLGARKDVVAEEAKSKYEAFQEVKSKLFFTIKSAWYTIYFTEKAIDITLHNIRLLQTFRELSLIKVRSGLASSVDVLRVDMEIADLENQLLLLKDNLSTQQITFNNLLNVEDQREIVLPDTLSEAGFSLSFDVMLDSIRRGNHQLMELEFMSTSYMEQERAAKKMGAPGFKIGVDYIFVGKSSNPALSSSESGRDAILFPTIGITLPLYRNKYKAMVREAVLMQEATEYKKVNKVNVLETTFANVQKEFNDAERRIPFYRKQYERAVKTMNILETDYATSGRNFEEILRVERQLLNYRLELEKARADKRAAIAFVGYLMGN